MKKEQAWNSLYVAAEDYGNVKHAFHCGQLLPCGNAF